MWLELDVKLNRLLSRVFDTEQNKGAVFPHERVTRGSENKPSDLIDCLTPTLRAERQHVSAYVHLPPLLLLSSLLLTRASFLLSA